MARALTKLGSVLGVDDGDIDVHLGPAEGKLLDRLRRAVSAGTEVELTYYSFGRDEHTRRVVAPWRVFAQEGSWYVHGWCHRAEGERIFRVDRIEEMEELNRRSAKRPDDAEQGRGVFHPREGDPTVTLELKPEAAWVVDTYPCQRVEELDDGRLVATLVITAIPWLERLLVRLGPAAVVVDQQGLEEADTLAAGAAERILARYR